MPNPVSSNRKYCTAEQQYLFYFLRIYFVNCTAPNFPYKSTGINDICILGYESTIHAMSQCCVAGLQQFNINRKRFV